MSLAGTLPISGTVPKAIRIPIRKTYKDIMLNQNGDIADNSDDMVVGIYEILADESAFFRPVAVTGDRPISSKLIRFHPIGFLRSYFINHPLTNALEKNLIRCQKIIAVQVPEQK